MGGFGLCRNRETSERSRRSLPLFLSTFVPPSLPPFTLLPLPFSTSFSTDPQTPFLPNEQIINPPRPGKKLLVLDLDYTIVDTKPLVDGSLPANECARPGLHEFLRTVYEHYDLCVWSQTSWRWLESKVPLFLLPL